MGERAVFHHSARSRETYTFSGRIAAISMTSTPNQIAPCIVSHPFTISNRMPRIRHRCSFCTSFSLTTSSITSSVNRKNFEEKASVGGRKLRFVRMATPPRTTVTHALLLRNAKNELK